MDNIILDESFIEFAGTPESVVPHFYEFKNLTIVRSMSKIFGIAGIRCGFVITKAAYVSELLNSGYLWNSNCFAVYFFELLNNKEFMKEYEVAKDKYNAELESYGKAINQRLTFSLVNYLIRIKLLKNLCSICYVNMEFI